MTIRPTDLRQPPPPGLEAEFAPDFGQRVLLTVDTEEEFDWNAEFGEDPHGLGHILKLADFQQFCEGLGVPPTYLIDWPIAMSKMTAEILGEPVAAGRADIGVQLHPWVNPPFEETINSHNSFAGNLPPTLEAAKFNRLRDRVEDSFGTQPMIYRGGRYGVGGGTAQMLKHRGVAIDSSVRPGFDYSRIGGPDFTHHPNRPYWTDADRTLLELPLTTVYWGPLRRQGASLQKFVDRIPRLGGILRRSGMLERLPLTPEGVSVEEARRGIDLALDDGLPLLVLSLHSPSLVPGNTPYVRNREDLDALYDWLRRIYAHCERRGVRPVGISEIVASVVV